MSRLMRGISRGQAASPAPRQPTRLSLELTGGKDRLFEPEPNSGTKRLVRRVLIESAIILALLAGVIFLTYQLGYLWLFDGDDGQGQNIPEIQGTLQGAPQGTQPASPSPNQGAAPAPAVPQTAPQPSTPQDSVYVIELTRQLSIEEADQELVRLETTYQDLLGTLTLSVRARSSVGGQPSYQVIAGPLFSPVTAEDLCGQIEAQGSGEICQVRPQREAQARQQQQVAPAASAPAPSQPAIASQDSELVGLVQRYLQDAGYGSGDPIGQLGSNTIESIKAYQLNNGLVPDGQITNELLEHFVSNPVSGPQQGADVGQRVTLPLGSDTRAAAPAAPVIQPGPVVGGGSELARMLSQRAERLMSEGDLTSARLLFEQAFSEGDPTAAAGVAKTFDPVYFNETGVVGLVPDPERAWAWYQRAVDGGDRTAVARLEKLLDWLQKRSASNDEAKRIFEALQNNR